eukprot:Lithocolla_globosa_v1_NODE_9730_length_673_cov_7.641357.p1 type:complete len:192 gc:universal NODE_9730_length_673_cov_7.641357:31-606(+)
MDQEETRAVIAEAIKIFNPENDLAVLREFKELNENTQKTRQQQQEQLKETLKEWTSKNQQKKKQIERVSSTTKLGQQIKQLDETKSSMKKGINKEEKENDSLAASLPRMKDQLLKLEDDQKKIEQEAMEEIPAIRYQVQLYHNLSSIRWDYNSPEHLVKGYVASNTGIQPFCLDSKMNSKVFIANSLWDLI